MNIKKAPIRFSSFANLGFQNKVSKIDSLESSSSLETDNKKSPKVRQNSGFINISELSQDKIDMNLKI